MDVYLQNAQTDTLSCCEPAWFHLSYRKCIYCGASQ